MEVMLEIYRTLKVLKMEWKPKKSAVEENAAGEDEEPKKRRRREEEERVKKAQELYFVETRCRMDDVMVRSLLSPPFSISSDPWPNSGADGPPAVPHRRLELSR